MGTRPLSRARLGPGRGKRSWSRGKRSLSNFDCFHYAYAKASDDPLLTLDRKLRQTDVKTLP